MTIHSCAQIKARSPSDLRILVVEDDDFQRNLMLRLLRMNHVIDIEHASDGLKALDAIEQSNKAFDLIISDLEMPNMDGMEFIRLLGERKSASALVITSAWNEIFLSSIQTMCNAYGIEPLGVLQKPITNENIANLLLKVQELGEARNEKLHNDLPVFSLDEILEGVRAAQFQPFFQPKIDLRTDRIVGAEALARWHHPIHGIISPVSFIPVLEKAGKINELTFSMIAQSAKACHAWEMSGLELDVSVNLSLTSLTDTKLASQIYETVRNAGLRPERMILEVTETAAMTEMAPALENLARLRMRGFGLSIDDFGTGFASMQQLSRVAFTELKIDRSFVSLMQNKREAKAIIQTSIDIASRLGIKSVAEGVETVSEFNALKQCGCDLAQGYYIARPLESIEFVELCHQTRVNNE